MSSSIATKPYRVKEGSKIDLDDYATRVKPIYASEDHYEKLLRKHTDELTRYQELLYASDRYALLVIFQAMDAAGKDGAIKHVMSGVNPQGCQVYSFKHPSATELDHDFLWRAAQRLPERGQIGIFNRSHYEEVLIVRVHRQLLEAEKLPKDLVNGKIWKQRFRSIVDFERHLHANGTRVIKFFLHISPEEQRERLLARLDDPEKIWKFNAADLDERRCWKDYMRAYEDAISATSTREAPWYIVPADDKKNAHLIISRAIIDTLEDLDMEYPKLTKAQAESMKTVRAQLEA